MRHRLLLALTLTGLLTQCSDDNEDEASPQSLTTLYTNSISVDCATECHNPTANNPANGPDWSTQTLFYENTVGQTAGSYSWDIAASCSSVAIVSAGSSDSSFLAATLDETKNSTLLDSTGCNASLSTHGTSVTTSTTISNIIAWIDEGALNN